MAAYTKARNLAVLMRHPKIVQLLTVSLGEEQNAGQLLDQVAAPPFLEHPPALDDSGWPQPKPRSLKEQTGDKEPD